MGECLITRRGGETYKLPILNANYPEDVTTTVIRGDTTSATFTVVIAEPGNPAIYTYQWYVNGTAVEGATSSSFTKDDLATTENYSVYCEVTNKKGTVATRIATLEVIQIYTPVLNSSYPANATVAKHNSVTSKVVITEDGNPASYTYQWYKDGTIVSGATSPSYTFTPTTTGTTTLHCIVTSSAGTVISRTATITATNLYLYKSGNEYTAITGGWSLYGGGTKGASSITLGNYGADTNFTKYARTNNYISLNGFSTLYVYFTSGFLAHATSAVYLQVINASGSAVASATVYSGEAEPAPARTAALDVSKVGAQKCYIRIYMSWSSASGSPNEQHLTFNEVVVT